MPLQSLFRAQVGAEDLYLFLPFSSPLENAQRYCAALTKRISAFATRRELRLEPSQSFMLQVSSSEGEADQHQGLTQPTLATILERETGVTTCHIKAS